MPDALRLPFDEPASFFVVVFVAILVGPILARWARLPGIVGLVLVGVAIGPGGAGLLQRDGTVALFGGAGLLHLMFLAGLDLDRESFHRERGGALVFSIATTLIPLVVVTGVGLAFGLDVLAVVAAAHRGTLGVAFWAGFVGSIVLFFAAAFTGLPRLAQWFFTGLGTDRTVRYSFTLALAFGAALLADVLGIEPIVGAFVAGLALDRFVPGDALLTDRIQFLGSSLLIPVFLVSTGMLIDPVELVTDPEGLLLGFGLTLAAVGSKVLSVYPTRLVTSLSRGEVGLVVGVAAASARSDGGVVLPLTVLSFDAGTSEVEQLRHALTEDVEAVALRNGADLRAVVRIDVTPSAGMLHTVIESGGSSILLGWNTDPGDIVIGGMSPTRAGLDRRASQLARVLPGRTLLMVSGR